MQWQRTARDALARCLLTNMLGKLLSYAILVAFLGSILGGIIIAAAAGINETERAECERWQRDARLTPGWYATSWQRAQCEHHGLPLPK